MNNLRLTEVSFTPSSDTRSGLLGFVSCVLNDALRFDGITLRITSTGRRTLTFPARRDRRGVDHPLIRPVSDEVRLEIERLVFNALGVGELRDD